MSAGSTEICKCVAGGAPDSVGDVGDHGLAAERPMQQPCRTHFLGELEYAFQHVARPADAHCLGAKPDRDRTVADRGPAPAVVGELLAVGDRDHASCGIDCA